MIRIDRECMLQHATQVMRDREPIQLLAQSNLTVRRVVYEVGTEAELLCAELKGNDSESPNVSLLRGAFVKHKLWGDVANGGLV